MSDSEQESLTSVELPALPEKKKRVVTEKHRAALLKNIEKARIVRAAKKVDRLKGEDEDKRLLREMLEEKKAAKKATTKKEAEPAKTKEEPKEGLLGRRTEVITSVGGATREKRTASRLRGGPRHSAPLNRKVGR